MITDKSKKRVIDLDAPDPTGLTLVQKQALCDEINRGVPFDRALETARSTTTSKRP